MYTFSSRLQNVKKNETILETQCEVTGDLEAHLKNVNSATFSFDYLLQLIPAHGK